MKQPEIREVRLEIVRPGKSHNQLLSPLTPYMALCGEGSPITFNIAFEHQQLLNKLELLRYSTKSAGLVTAIGPRLREAEVAQTGNDVARILCSIDSLAPELARAQDSSGLTGSNVIVHLRMILSGSELSLIPFEMALSPLAYPGEGLEFCLQGNLPVVVTREIRRTRPLLVKWQRPLKVLIAFAEPEGLKVPAREHIRAIRAAIEPWVRHESNKTAPTQNAESKSTVRDQAKKRLALVKARVRVLPNATIAGIYNLCAKENFTHVHILAHGDRYERAGEARYGVALCKDDGFTKDIVSGKRLARALQAEDQNGNSRSQPLVVTLATCDSGNQTTVLSPGGSIAHDLHGHGIPWVFASQFPLSFPGSVLMAQVLYERLFRGDDPRQVLFELRRQLYINVDDYHDWASLVVYAALSHDLSEDVHEFRSHQMREAINVLLERADQINEADGETPQQIDQIIDEVETWLSRWKASAPDGSSPKERSESAEIIGMHGSTYKRIALLLSRYMPEQPDRAKLFYRKAMDSYRDTMTKAAVENMKYYWSATQYLCLAAISSGAPEPDTLELARRLAERDIEGNEAADTMAWAHATLAELELLALYHRQSSRSPSALADPSDPQKRSTEKSPALSDLAAPSDQRERAIKEAPAAGPIEETPTAGQSDLNKVMQSVAQHCNEVRALMGPTSFHVASTLRQFKRYHDQWGDKNPQWRAIASRAIDALAPANHSELKFEYARNAYT